VWLAWVRAVPRLYPNPRLVTLTLSPYTPVLGCAAPLVVLCAGRCREVVLPLDAGISISGQWTLIRHGHPAVTETTLWLSSTSGGIVFNLAASAAGFPGADIWGLTVTAEDGIEVIPTRTSPAITGKVDWFVDNVPAAYYSGSCGKVFMAGEWNSGGCLDVVTDTSGVGRQDNDGTHWHLSNSAAIEIATANLVPAGVDLLQFRWNSSVALDGGAIFAEVLRNGVTQTWDVAPVAPWVPASPTAIRLSGYGSTSCWAGVQEVKIWSRP
jgi:hypothetical protein